MGIAKSVTARLDASRKRTRDRAREVTYLLSVLTQKHWRQRSHITASVDKRQESDWNHVVCVHDGDEAMAWRFSDDEIAAYFSHLGPARPCEHGSVSRDQKMDRLEELASKCS